MQVEFLKEWRGTPVGRVMEITDNFAIHDLIPRGIVKEYVKPKPRKQTKAAPKDKMVKGAANK